VIFYFRKELKNKMVHLNKNISEITTTTTADMETLAELSFKNPFSIPFSDRRISDRRRTQAINMKKITVLIPCYNEEKGIGKVIDGVPIKQLTHLGFQTEIIIINNNSSDHTTKVAMEKGAKVILEKKQGKGNAIKTGFRNISNDTDYVVMLDGDNTYKSEEIPRLIEPLENDFCDIVIGSRLEGKLNGTSLSLSHKLANWFLTFLVRRFYLVNTTDTCTGYFAWKKKVVDELVPHIKSDGFAIEAEMITKMARLGYKIFSVPITYDRREGNSKLSPYFDGIKITWMLFKNLMWKPKE
jgi:glycosyltransferase involved in cell wall biosynthesis